MIYYNINWYKVGSIACIGCGMDGMEGKIMMVEKRVRYEWTRRFFGYFEENLQSFWNFGPTPINHQILWQHTYMGTKKQQENIKFI